MCLLSTSGCQQHFLRDKLLLSLILMSVDPPEYGVWWYRSASPSSCLHMAMSLGQTNRWRCFNRPWESHLCGHSSTRSRQMARGGCRPNGSMEQGDVKQAAETHLTHPIMHPPLDYAPTTTLFLPSRLLFFFSLSFSSSSSPPPLHTSLSLSLSPPCLQLPPWVSLSITRLPRSPTSSSI